MERTDAEKNVSRRFFFKGTTGVAVGAAAATAALLMGATRPARAAPADPAASPGKQPDDVLTMQADLKRALDKPMAQRKWAMVIDVRKCIGCNACSVACMAENNLPPGVAYRTVAEAEYGDYPDVHSVFMPANCMQCEVAPCMKAANGVSAGSMSRREDGIVVVHYRAMKGRKAFAAATAACPYPGSLHYDKGRNHTDMTPVVQSYEKRAVKEYGESWSRTATKGVTRKCHFCTQRLDAGLLPACITTCTGQAMHFGDLSDQESLISRVLKSNKSVRLELASGTGPVIHYVDTNPAVSCMQCHQ